MPEEEIHYTSKQVTAEDLISILLEHESSDKSRWRLTRLSSRTPVRTATRPAKA
jgi:hypothetical protein